MANFPWTVDYETGNDPPDQYDSYTQDNDVTTVDATAKKTGSYGLHLTFDGNTNDAYGQFFSEAITEGYFATHIQIVSGFTSVGTYSVMPFIKATDAATILFNIYFQTNGSSVPYRWGWSTNSGLTAGTSTDNFSLGAWHWVEVYWSNAAAGTTFEIYIDETQITSQAVDQSAYEIDNVKHALISGGSNPSNGAELYFDNFIGAASAITEPTAGAGSAPKIISSGHFQRRRKMSRKGNILIF